MIGSIIGDIIGSRFEWNRDIKPNYDFELFHKNCKFTDDTVQTVALMDSILSDIPYNQKLKEYYLKYPNVPYGKYFRNWVLTDINIPYKSWGNGSAMRISPAGFYGKNLKEVNSLTRKFTNYTHNSVHGLNGALSVSNAIHLSLIGINKDSIISWISKEYYTVFDFNDKNMYIDLINNYKFDASCQNSVPQAIYCFYISDSFEDCIRKCVTIGGDTDTICAISGSIAEAYYGIPSLFKNQVKEYLNNELIHIINSFYKLINMEGF